MNCWTVHFVYKYDMELYNALNILKENNYICEKYSQINLTDENIPLSVLKKESKKLDELNRNQWKYDNLADKWSNYNDTLTVDLLIEAFIDGFDTREEVDNNSNMTEEQKNDWIDYFKSTWIKKIAKPLLSGNSLTIYRGLRFNELPNVNLLKYNLMKRNSWTISINKAKHYSKATLGNNGTKFVLLKTNCVLEETNLPLTAWLEGFYTNCNYEINLKRSYKPKNVEIFIDSK